MFQNAGDVNNDGKDDLIIGANGWNLNAGRAFVVYGQSVSQCPMKMYLSGNGTCKNCTLGNGCLNCSGKTEECTSCPMEMFINGTGCKNCTLGNGCLNCSGINGTCTSCPNGKVVSGTGCVDGGLGVGGIIEIAVGGGVAFIVSVIIIAAIVVVVMRKKRKKQSIEFNGGEGIAMMEMKDIAEEFGIEITPEVLTFGSSSMQVPIDKVCFFFFSVLFFSPFIHTINHRNCMRQ